MYVSSHIFYPLDQYLLQSHDFNKLFLYSMTKPPPDGTGRNRNESQGGAAQETYF